MDRHARAIKYSRKILRNTEHHLRRIPPHWALAFAVTLTMFFVFQRAWVAEDAYITLRVVENFTNGFGLRWNIAERVQVYTHPLWLLLHLPLAALWDNLFYITLGLGLACSLVALVLPLLTVKRPLWLAAGCFLLPFILSKSVIDYTTSGLETPLSYALFAAFGYVVVKLREHRHFWFYCSLCVALAVMTRLDVALLYAPVLLVLVFSDVRAVRWRQIFAGALPLIYWCMFSLWYYGFLFPNTKYAKLDTGLPLILYLTQSLNYVKHLMIWDSAGFILLLSSALFLFCKERLAVAFALGIYFYCAYILYIGGDYMAGRFWALPIYATLWLWYAFFPEHIRRDVIFAGVCVLIVASFSSPSLRDMNKSCDNCLDMKGRILDATRTFGANRLVINLPKLKFRSEGQYYFCRDGRKITDNQEQVTKIMFYVGMHTFCAGANLHAIDMLGLGDALLARLPASNRRGFYIGHFRRDIPKGYEHAVKTGDASRMDPNLGYYYQVLRLIIVGDLFSAERLKTIVLFNLGYYDQWKGVYANARR